ncbi:MAG: phenylalanine--tRNA ligase subunit alpha [Deltaproteobacteria bacterium]|nr:MAG: phenylalanine--tRNA ligase subunit alpha [Deltaproteobacteria bacterium]
MQEQLEEIQREALRRIEGVRDEASLARVKAEFLGRKGKLTALLRGMNTLPPEARPSFGKRINEVKAAIARALEEAKERLDAERMAGRLEQEKLDPTLPGQRIPPGHRHPITTVMAELEEIFVRLGFDIAEGPETELDWFNFEALNIPKDHPARDMQDTFFIQEDVVLRTHTSPVQIRTMQARRPPLRIISPGKVFRCDDDVTHSPMFHQIEGLMVDEDVSLADLKGILHLAMREIFGPDTRLRLRPSFFPFTEPSAEVDISCVICHGRGCRVCSQTGWLEILGCGMVDPAVFTAVGYDPETYTGFAFGMGVERIAMLKYGISDIRLFFENDWRFLQQF